MSKNFQRYLVAREDMVTHVVEDRRASLSSWGRGNSKLGSDVYTYSKPAGREWSCPGSTDYCEKICYAKRMGENEVLGWLYERNATRGDALPDLPADARLVRGHVSGDFDTVGYVESWITLVRLRPEVQFWFYTRSWRVPEVLPALEVLRGCPNVQVWASMDPDCELPPSGWRRAWLDSDARGTQIRIAKHAYRTVDGVNAIVCPEEAGTKPNCSACKYCFDTEAGDLVFIEHGASK